MLRLKRIWEGDKPKLSHYLDELKPKKVLIPFGHGLGDTIMFLNVFDKLSSLYPDVEFILALQKGLGFEELEPDIIGKNRKVIYVSDLSYDKETFIYDIIADIDFPMSENQTEITKAERCCRDELGIELVAGHKRITCSANKLVGLHFQITCLPDSANVSYDIAKKIWQEIKDAGYIPMETLMKHPFHNPVNEKYDFIDRHIRDIPPKVSTLIGIIKNCERFICCVSGNFHVALSILPPEKICLLERDFKTECFTKLPIKRINVKEYPDGEILRWLQKNI